MPLIKLKGKNIRLFAINMKCPAIGTLLMQVGSKLYVCMWSYLRYLKSKGILEF